MGKNGEFSWEFYMAVHKMMRHIDGRIQSNIGNFNRYNRRGEEEHKNRVLKMSDNKKSHKYTNSQTKASVYIVNSNNLGGKNAINNTRST